MTDDTLNPEAIRADMEAGTLGPWIGGNSPDGEVIHEGGAMICTVNYEGTTVAQADADARRIARLPDLERGYLDMRARAALTDAQEGRDDG